MTARIAVVVTGIVVWLAGLSSATAPAFQLKVIDAPPPDSVASAIRPLLQPKAYRIVDGEGKVVCEVWFRRDVETDAAIASGKKQLEIADLPETSLLGVIRFPDAYHDYRDQEVPAGVYTLRLAFQPQDGDHMGTAPYPEFCLLTAVKLDKKPDLMEPADLHDLSSESIESGHPCILLLFPNDKAGNTRLADMGMDHWVLQTHIKVRAGGKTIPLGIGLTIAGISTAA